MIRIGGFGMEYFFYDCIGIEMVIYPVTKFWLFVAVDKVEVASGMNGGVLVWKSNCAAA